MEQKIVKTKESYLSTRTGMSIDKETLLRSYYTMTLSRLIDQRFLKLISQGKGSFHVAASGHEASQVAAACHLRPGKDWSFPYYRDLAFCLAMGFTARDVMLDFLGKEGSPSSKGRQMMAHWGKKEHRIVSQSACTGTQFLHAVGSAVIHKKERCGNISFVSSGDGATSQGDMHEALNWSARDRLPIVFFIEDNGYAISVPKSQQTAGGSIAKIASGYEGLLTFTITGWDFISSYEEIGKAIDYCRRGKGPVLIQANVVRLYSHSSSDSHLKYRTEREVSADWEKDCLVFFENRLKNEYGISKEEREVAIHSAKKDVDAAQAWAFSQADPNKDNVLQHVYSPNPLSIQFEKKDSTDKSVVMVEAINNALSEEMHANPNMIIYGQDVQDDKGGVFTATRGLTNKYGEERVFNSQLAESSIVGTAIGMALMGYKPVVEIQFADYIFTSTMQIRNELAMMRYRSGGNWSSPVVIRTPTGGYIGGGHYHSQNIEAFFAHMPGLYVAYPSNAEDAKGLLKTACRMEDPVLFLEHKFLYRHREAKSLDPGSDFYLPFGKASIKCIGEDATIITYGALVHQSVSVAQKLEASEGISIEVVDLRTLVPYDKQTILTTVKKTGRVLVAHEDVLTQGFGAEISSYLSEHAFEYLDAPIQRLGGTDTPVPYHEFLEDEALPNEKNIYDSVLKLLSY